MSVESLAVVLNHSRATGAAKLIMIGVANHDGDGGAFPAIKTLARYANVNHRNAKRHIKALEDAGELRRHIMAGGFKDTPDHERPNRYDVLVTCPPGCDRTTNHKPLPGWKRAPEGTPGGGFVPVDNTPLTGGGASAPGVTSAPTGGGASAPQTIPSTSDETGTASVTGSREGLVPRCAVCGGTMARCALTQAKLPVRDHDFTPTDNKAPTGLPDAVEAGGRSDTPGGSPAQPGEPSGSYAGEED